MIYGTMLDFLGLYVPKSIQVIILVALGVFTYMAFRKKLRIAKDLVLSNFKPILYILLLIVINRVIYFFTMKNIVDGTIFMRVIFCIIIIILIWEKFGLYWVCSLFTIPINSLLITPLRIFVALFYITLFFVFISVPLLTDALLFTGIFIFFRKYFNSSKLLLIIYFVCGLCLSILFNAYLGIELILLAKCLELCIRKSKLAGFKDWVIFFVMGFFLTYVIYLCSAHIWGFLLVLFILRCIYKIV